MLQTQVADDMDRLRMADKRILRKGIEKANQCLRRLVFCAA